jgi:hypothetical protein
MGSILRGKPLTARTANQPMVDSTFVAERRSEERRELKLELRFCYQRGRHTYHGSGRTRDFSDKVICFESDHEVPRGVQLELCIAWPVSLQGSLPLEMVIHGALVRRQHSLVVLRLEQFEFRTQCENYFHERAAQGDLCNLLA